MATNKKITQVQLGTETYDIDVAADRKAKPLLQTEDDSDLTKVLPKSAVLKPDGTNDLFDENKKLNSHYISDTILGQLKFGGTITYNNEYPTGTHQYVITPSSSLRAHLLAKAPEGTSTLVGFSFEIKPQNFPAENWCKCTLQAYNSVPELLGQPTLYLKDFEGFYFIYKELQYTAPELKNSEQAIIVPKFEVGDWFLTCGEAIQKIDNTDTITHIDETNGTSLLEITGSSGLKLNGFTRDSSTGDITLTNELNTTADITSVGDITAQSIYGRIIEATGNMKAPTISDTTDKTQVVNLDYFENNATKVNWEKIDSEVHVINDHNVEIDGGLTVHCVSTNTKIEGDLEITGDLSFGADSHLVFGTIKGTDFIADYAKVKNAPTEADDVVNKAYFDANKGSSGGDGLPSGAAEGAFLRWRNSQAVWEVIPSAEGNTF